MTCARCGKANREGARFCDGCGAALAPRCPACGAEGRPGAAFCEACGTALAARPAPVEARKTVTIVFADLIGSTSLHERLDPESVRRVMDHYYRAVRAPIEAHGGTVVQLLGDGVMCAFGVPLVAEDDAIRAVRAAVAMQEAFREFVRKERDVVGDAGLRVAVNTGEVVVTDEHAAGIGDPLNVAARLQQEAHDGDVLIGEATERLVRDLVTLEPVGTFALKGRAETVRAFRVLSLERPTGAAAAAFVGRDEDLRRLLAVYESAVRTPGARLAAILGSPGVGKSRLLAEFARRLGRQATMLGARCDAAGGGTFAPLADALREHLRLPAGAGRDAVRAAVEALLPGEESSRIAAGIAALLAGTPAAPEETFFVVRRLLGAVAAPQPVVLTIDDVQWAEPLLLDLIEHLVQWSTTTPLLVLVAARPELRDTRSSLAAPGGLVAAVVTLGGLDAGAATRLAANVIGAEELPAAIAGRVLATSEGNPLFVGELVRMLVHDGVLRREGDRWTTGVELATFELPPTIHALLAARIERLRPAERTILERAAVVGRQFSRAAVANLLPADITDLDARLETLRRSELIEPDTGWLLGEPVMRFHHVLIRDAAYRRVLKGTRAELHARFADWLETRSGAAVEHDETLGWHLEQAHQHLRELGPIDAKGRALGERAARHLGAAGRRALARDDLPLAASLLGRAIDRLDAADPARADLALDWCEALLAGGDVGPAAAAIHEVGRLAAGSDRLRAWHTCFVGQRAVLMDPQSLRPTADAVAAAAETLAAAGDAAGEAKAHAVHAGALGRLGEVGAAEAALDRALAAARRAQDRRRANAVLAGAPIAALWGPSPVTRASGRCLDVVRLLRITQGAPAVEAVALRCQAVLEALRGRTEAARRMIAASRRMVEELGITQRLLEADMFAGIIELLEGEAAAAERLLRIAYEGLRRQGLRIDAAQAAALLGRALLAAGKAADAEALSHESEALAGDDLKAAIAWRGVRAEALARRGEHAEAVALARAAVDIAAATDALLDHADARLALAAALSAAGRADEASAEELRAIDLWDAKGASLLAERARRAVSGLAPAAPAVEPRAAVSLAPRRPPTSRFTNAAVRAIEWFKEHWLARDWDGVMAMASPAATLDDRRRLMRLQLSGEDYVAHARLMFATRFARWETDLLATRGERLALFRVQWEGDAQGVEATAEFLWILEVDDEGRRKAAVMLDLEDVEAAYVELEERYAAGEGAPYAELLGSMRAFRIASEERDWDAVARLLPVDFTLESHRRLVGMTSVIDRDEYLATRDKLQDLRLQGRIRVDHVLRIGPRAGADVMTWYGTIDGGNFEDQFIRVYDHDGCRAHHVDIFDVEQLDAALRRYEQLEGGTISRFANTASRLLERGSRAWVARDWEPFEETLAPTFRCFERRRMVRLELDRQDFLRYARPLFDMSSRLIVEEPIATRGDRLALVRMRGVGEDASVGPSEIEELAIGEVDALGKLAALVVFDPEDVDAAYAELDDRHDDHERAARGRPLAVSRLPALFAARQWDCIGGLLSPALIVQDHRALGWGTIHGPADYLALLKSLAELSPDAVIRADHMWGHDRGMLIVTMLRGTREGGTFEDPRVLVAELDAQNRVCRLDVHSPEQLDEAIARFEALRGEEPIDNDETLRSRASIPTNATDRIPPNTAMRTSDRWQEAYDRQDWAGVEAQFARSLEYDDRRRLTRLTGDRETLLASVRYVGSKPGTRVSRSTLATAGDRLVLERYRWAGGGMEAGFEVEGLCLTEVDAEERVVAHVVFDVDDRRAASREMLERFLRSDATRPLPPESIEFLRALFDHDLERCRAALPDGFVLDDHRRTGMGRVEGADAYVESLAALFAQAPNAVVEPLYHVAVEAHGILTVAHTFGTLVDGGEFESVYVQLGHHSANGVIDAELYELDDLNVARARFEELRPKATLIPPNAASRVRDLMHHTIAAGSEDGFRALLSADFVYDDRTRQSLVRGGVDEALRSAAHYGALQDVRFERKRIAALGDRLLVEHLRVRGGPPGGEAEVEGLLVTEIDAEGHVVALVNFDVDDRRAALAEAHARFAAGEAAGLAGQVPVLAIVEALGAHDYRQARRYLAEDFVIRDHRSFGLFEGMSGEDWLDSLRVHAEMAPDLYGEILAVLAVNDYGRVELNRVMGTAADGVAFENVFLRVTVSDGTVIRHLELFEPEDRARALARFEELSAASSAARAAG